MATCQILAKSLFEILGLPWINVFGIRWGIGKDKDIHFDVLLAER